MRRVSLNARQALDDQNNDEIEVALFIIRHAALDRPVRVSSDPTERISETPLMYGTRSSWQTADSQADPFLAVPISTLLPSDLDDAPATANLVIELIDSSILADLRSFTDYATVDMAVVLASSPDQVEMEFLDLKVSSFDADTGEVTITLSRQPIEDEPHPADRMTRERFPGMHR